MRAYDPTPKTPAIRRPAPNAGRCIDCPKTGLGSVSERVNAKDMSLALDKFTHINPPELRQVTSQHCAGCHRSCAGHCTTHKWCWCRSRTVMVYGTRGKNYMLEDDQGDCYMVSPGLVHKHSKGRPPPKTRYEVLTS